MPKYEMLNNVQHDELKINTERASGFGDDVMFCMTFPFEFRLALSRYPIVVYQDPDNQKYYPVTLFGFAEGENLFLNDSGWDASYIPIMIQRQPFAIGFQQRAGETEESQVVTIDTKHPRVNKTLGYDIFNENGGYTPYLEKVVKMLESIDNGHEQNQILIDALFKHDLLENTTFEITLNNGQQHKLVGFSTVSEDRFMALEGAALEELNQSGLLLSITMMIASLSQLRNLIDRENAKLELA